MREPSHSRSSSSRSSRVSGRRAGTARALASACAAVTLVALGTLFAEDRALAGPDAHVVLRTDLEVANAYTSFFRVTSLFKDPSLYGRHLVIPIVAAPRRVASPQRAATEWLVSDRIRHFLSGASSSPTRSRASSRCSWSQSRSRSSGGTDGLAIVLAHLRAGDDARRGGRRGNGIEGRSARDVTSGRSRLVEITFEAFKLRPVVGVGIGGQPQASSEASGRRTRNGTPRIRHRLPCSRNSASSGSGSFCGCCRQSAGHSL